VVLLHTCGGVRGHLYTWAGVLANHGYASLIVDSFTPRGLPACQGRSIFPASIDEVTDDAFAALEHLRSRPGIDGRRVGVMGFSFGASASLRIASPRYHRRARQFGAVVSFYPLCAPYSRQENPRAGGDNLYGDLDTPTLILMGGADDDTPNVVTNCVDGVDRLRRAGRPIAINVYPGAGHVFDVHHPEATRQASAALLEFFDRHLRADATR
jgi:dienelactone hydrolase